MNIEKLFSTKQRLKILRTVIYYEQGFGVNEIAKKLRLSKGLVSKYFEILAREGVVKKRKNGFFVLDNSKVKAIKIMLNITRINPRIFKKYRFVRAAGLYGSCAKGTNTETSDVDLWVKVDPVEDEKVAEFTSELRKRIEDVKVLVVDDKKLKALEEKDSLFYHSLHFGSIMLYGGENDGLV